MARLRAFFASVTCTFAPDASLRPAAGLWVFTTRVAPRAARFGLRTVPRRQCARVSLLRAAVSVRPLSLGTMHRAAGFLVPPEGAAGAGATAALVKVASAVLFAPSSVVSVTR